ncbi:MAG: outer membrane protein assembly factor BamB [Planctomycetota bacterium]
MRNKGIIAAFDAASGLSSRPDLHTLVRMRALASLQALLVLPLLGSCQGASTITEDWTSFRGGTTHLGLAANAAMILESQLVWEFDTGGAVFSSAAISTGKDITYIGSDDQHVYALNLRDGSER